MSSAFQKQSQILKIMLSQFF